MPKTIAMPSPAPLPADAFPHLVDLIFAAASPHSLLALRTACRVWRKRADTLLVRHLHFDGMSFLISEQPPPSASVSPTATPSPSPSAISPASAPAPASTPSLPTPAPTSPASPVSVTNPTAPDATPGPMASTQERALRVPAADWLATPLTSDVRTLDIAPLPRSQPVQPARLAPASRFRGLRTVRLGRVLDYWEHGLFDVDTLIIPPADPRCGGSTGLTAGHFDLLRKQVRRRIVVHVAGPWPERVFANLGTTLRFGRAEELVLVFGDLNLPSTQDAPDGIQAQTQAPPPGFAPALSVMVWTRDPLAALDVVWPHLAGGVLRRVDIVNSGRARRDWEPQAGVAGQEEVGEDESEGSTCVRDTEQAVWRRFEGSRGQQGPHRWAREELLSRVRGRVRFLSLDEYADEVREAYATEMCL